MGYYTTHSLRVFGFNTETQSATMEVESYFPEYQDISDMIAARSGYEDPFEDSIKWYDCEKDMKYISKKFPNLLFEISGEGEESGDLWRAYFQNGDTEHVAAKIIFDSPSYSGISDR